MELRTDEVVCQELEGELVLLDLRTSQYLGINASGAVIYEALRDGADEAGLVDVLQREFDISSAQAEQDVTHFLARLRDADLLHE